MTSSSSSSASALTRAQFEVLRRTVEAEAGIHLNDSKQVMVAARLLRRVRTLGLSGFGAYVEHLLGAPEERVELVNALCTHETEFFREPHHFDFLRAQAERWRHEAALGTRARRVRVWCAGCSTGEEPFSVAMTLLDGLPGWDLQVLATDVSTRILERAREATWPIAAAARIPRALLRAYMLRGVESQAGWMRADPRLRAAVEFRHFNLRGDGWGALPSFELIFCRNVLIYFDAALKAQVVSHLLERLAPGGFLFLGHAESLTTSGRRVRAVAPTVYAPQAAPGEARP